MSTYAELLVSNSNSSRGASANPTNLQAEHNSLPAFSPFLPSSSLQPLAITFLSLAFILSFYFSTCVSTYRSFLCSADPFAATDYEPRACQRKSSQSVRSPAFSEDSDSSLLSAPLELTSECVGGGGGSVRQYAEVSSLNRDVEERAE